jgi:hypothetical protein
MGRRSRTDEIKENPDQITRRAGLAADVQRLKNGVETGELIERAQIERDYAVTFQTLASLLDIVPDLLEQLGVAPAAAARVERRLDTERAALAKRIAGFDTPAE